MIKILKIDQNTILENFEPVIQEPVEFDQDGNPTKFQERWIIPQDVNQLKAMIKDTLTWLEKQKIQQICDKYGYNGLSDIQFYANQNDTEAQQLLDWYQTYDDLIWNWIDNELPKYTTIDELLALDMKQIEKDLFNQSIQQSPLP